MNFGPQNSTLLESTGAGLHDPEILWVKVPKWRRYGDGGENRKTPTFSKVMNFGPHIVTLLESPRAGLHDTKILWAKVQKRRRYGDGAKTGKPPLLKKSNFSLKKYV